MAGIRLLLVIAIQNCCIAMQFMPFYSVFGVYRVSNKKFFSASRNVNKNYNNYCLLDCY